MFENQSVTRHLGGFMVKIFEVMITLPLYLLLLVGKYFYLTCLWLEGLYPKPQRLPDKWEPRTYDPRKVDQYGMSKDIF